MYDNIGNVKIKKKQERVNFFYPLHKKLSSLKINISLGTNNLQAANFSNVKNIAINL